MAINMGNPWAWTRDETVVYTMGSSPDGSRIAILASDGLHSANRYVQIGDVATGRRIAVRAVRECGQRGVVWSPDGSRIAVLGGDRVAYIHDATTGAPLIALAAVASLSWSPDGSQIAVAYDCGDVSIHAAVTFAPLRRVAQQQDVSVTPAWSPDGSRLATETVDSRVIIWDAARRQKVRHLRAQQYLTRYLEFSRDGERISVVSHDNSRRTRIYDVTTGRLLQGPRRPHPRIAGRAR